MKFNKEKFNEFMIYAVPTYSYYLTVDTWKDLPGNEDKIVRTMFTRDLSTMSNLGVLTPNSSSPYQAGYIDLSKGPVVFHMPAADERTMYLGQFTQDDYKQEEVGMAGADAGAGGKYLLRYAKDETPYDEEDYVRVFTFNSPNTAFPIRSASREQMTYQEKAEAFADRFKFETIDGESLLDEVNWLDDKRIYAHVTYTFENSAYIWQRMIDRVEWDARQTELFADMGIDRDTDIEELFNSNKETLTEWFNDFSVEHQARTLKFIREESREYPTSKSWHSALLTYYTFNKDTNKFIFKGGPENEELLSIIFHYAIFLPMSIGLGMQYYVIGSADEQGDYLRGDSTYSLAVPMDVPVNSFWEFTVYNAEDHCFMYDEGNPVRVAISQLNDEDTLEVTEIDGKPHYILYVSKELPEGVNPANWLNNYGKDFYTIFRMYGPKEEVITQKFQLNEIIKVK